MCIDWIFESITLALSAGTLIAACTIPRQVFRNQVFIDLLKDYRTKEMGKAISKIMSFYRDTAGEKIDNVSKEFTKILHSEDKKKKHYAVKLDNHRRLVIQFYDMLSLEAVSKSGHLLARTKKYFSNREADVASVALEMTRAKGYTNEATIKRLTTFIESLRSSSTREDKGQETIDKGSSRKQLTSKSNKKK